MIVVVVQGELRAPEDARVSVLDRGFVLGDGALETLAVVRGAPVWLEDHLDRLATALEVLRIDVSLDAVRADVARVCAEIGSVDGVLRVVVTRGIGPLGPRMVSAGPPTRVVLFAAQAVPIAGERVSTTRLAVVPWPAAWVGSAGIKLPSYGAQIVARALAAGAGCDDALLVNERGLVVEATTACIIARDRGGVLVTPPATDGPLASITSRHVRQLAASAGLATCERSIALTELRDQCDAALVSSLQGLVRVASLDGVPAAGDGSWVAELAARLRDSVGAGAAAPVEA